MKKVTAVIATQAKDIKEFENRPIFKSLQRQYDSNDLFRKGVFDFVIVKDNKEGLSKLYNTFLEDPKHQKSILLFVHDDVELEDLLLVDKLQNSPYEVTGLAGAKSINLSKAPAWHLMSERPTHVGEVAHAADSRVWTTVFGSTNSRALVLDGLFLAIDVEAVTTKGAKFDKDFNFHHYDLAFCLDCNAKKVKMGVLPIRVVHHGLGDSMNTPDWMDSAKLFSKKFGT